MSKASLELGGGNWGTKDGNLLAYAQGNESSNLVPREFTFTRGSDIAATRINSSGLIEKYRENLLLQSNQFNTTWTLTSASVTSGQSGYDGSNDAWKLESSTSDIGSKRVQQIVNVGGVKSYSVYAKAGTANFLIIGGSVNARYFDLANGSVGALVGTNSPASIESVGNGWYRCTMVEVGTTNIFQLYVANTNSSTAALAGDNIYIQDAQLEKGLVATSYLESGATKATSGVADNEPRIDYAGGTASLLLEPQRTNYLASSEYIASWQSIGSITLTANYGTSPEGVQNSTRVQFSGASQEVREAATSLTGCVASIYVKGTSGETIKFGSSGSEEVFTLNGSWQRLEKYNSGIPTNITINTYSGATARDIELWGAQVEQGSYPTSYIPTYGTSVTRNGENTQLDISSLGITDEFTVFIDTNGALVDGTSLNEMGDIRWHTQTTNRYRFYKSSDLAYISNLIQVDDRTKIALKITASECKTFVDGVLNSTISLTTPFASFDSINRNTETKVKDDLNQISLFSTALTDKEAVDLTSPYSTYQELVTAEGLTWESPTCTTNSITELQSI